MNAVEQFILEHADALDVMQKLQQENLISDNCILPSDIADADVPAAVQFLNFIYG